MATNLGTAYVQIMPSAKGIGSNISKELSGGVGSAGDSAGRSWAGTFMKAVAAAGVGTFIKQSLDAGGALQQSFGGLDTIYGNASESMKSMAYEAAQAGISANTYAEQAVSFGASLKQAFGGDVTKAAEAANTAILDMADNSAKMGTDISMVQASYQSFARGNYAMLDNLKLGYGGTKSEMERLLADAEKLSGVHYDISNFGDVTAAIHVIQQDLGLTGVAADEAATTFTGSMGAMKAAAENVMANLALGESINEPLEVLLGNLQTFVKNNLIPMIANVLKGIPTLITGIFRMAIDGLKDISANMPQIIDFLTSFVGDIATSILEMAPYLIEAAVGLVSALFTALIETDWVTKITEFVQRIKDNLSVASAEILGSDSDILTALITAIETGLPQLLETGVSIITNIAQGILDHIPDLLTTAGDLVTQLVEFIFNAAPQLIDQGLNLILNLISGIVEALPDIISTMGEVLGGLLKTISDHLPDLVEMGKNIIHKIGEGIKNVITHLPDILKSIGEAAWNAFKNVDWIELGKSVIELIVEAIKEVMSLVWELLKTIGETAWQWFSEVDWLQLGLDLITFIVDGVWQIASSLWEGLKDIASTAWDKFSEIDWLQVGIDIIQGIIDGIWSVATNLYTAIKNVARQSVNEATDVYDIGSPSKVFANEVGRWIPAGIAMGIENGAGAVQNALADIASESVSTLDAGLTIGASNGFGNIAGGQNNANISINVYPSPGMDERALAEEVSRQMAFMLQQQQAVWGV